MNIKYSTLALLGLSLLSSCRQDIDIVYPETPKTQTESYGNERQRPVFPDVLRLKFSPDLAARIESKLQSESGSLRALDAGTQQFLEHIGAIRLERVFPHAGEFEDRQRAAGLHLWYDIDLKHSEQAPYEALAFALQEAKATPGIQIAEEVPMLQEPSRAYKLLEGVEELRATNTGSMFDDPDLPKQWHYHNTGQTLRSKAGADINLFEAWQMETGKPNVVVAIVDGGVDYLHEDLRDNMFVNLKELQGTEGVDDDNNGKIDDIYGYNFVTDSGDITPHEHGTHVAGTVAARNNNGLGVAGVAGGDGSDDSGIRLLSCQMFHTNAEGRTISSNSSGARAIVYGANMGAVISQNSWGYVSPPNQPLPLGQAEKEAIDYFIKYAGCDKDGNQLPNSPMKGGVVIFAAGNDGRDYQAFPGAYSPVVSVSAMAPDFTASYYTNRGDWVSIMAPGGSFLYSKGEILSTLPGHKYGYMQGTSMACPHVSGIAALIVSKYGKQGFTNTELKQRLKSALKLQNIDEYNPKFKHKLGAGYIDAALALAPKGTNQPPAVVNALMVEATHTGVKLSWDVSSDANDGAALSYNLYYSEVPITSSNYKSALMNSVTGSRVVGQKIEYLHQGLTAGTKYYYAVEAVDRWGAVSPKVTMGSATTLTNLAPELRLDDASPIRLTGGEFATRKILVREPDGQKWSYEIEGEDYDVKHKLTSKGEVELQFRVSRPKGEYVLKVAVTDELGLKSVIDIPFVFYKNLAPIQGQNFGRLYVAQGKNHEIELSNYFRDPDGDALGYEIRSLNPQIATASVQGNKLIISGLSLGVAGFDLVARDPMGTQIKCGLTVECVASDLVHSLYPTLVEDVLHIGLMQGIGKVYVSVLSPSGVPIIRGKAYTLQAGQDTITLQLKDLPTGSYTLLVETPSKEFMQSFIKR
ncbi:MAG: S8 family serine peptidase [Porphyromonadaceae bacterium]|nr:S8 family serine peptidase [Porphyromonadaceae bacterium]